MITELRSYPWYLAPVVWVESITHLTTLSELLAKHREKTVSQLRRPRSVGEIIDFEYLTPREIEDYELAEQAKIDEEALLDVCLGISNLTPEMAEKLGETLGTGAAFWLDAENRYHEFVEREKSNVSVSV